MARVLSASVWRMGGRNLPADVINVQELLNQVPAAEGGPMPLLDVDGLCGPKTIAAIQKFQLQHFGWHGADGRVDAGGPTLAKLNEHDGRVFGAPVPVTILTAMSCPHGGAVLATSLRKTLVLTTSDQFTIAGCPSITPCVRLQWNGPPGQPLNTRSVGTCFNLFNAPQGTIKFK